MSIDPRTGKHFGEFDYGKRRKATSQTRSNPVNPPSAGPGGGAYSSRTWSTSVPITATVSSTQSTDENAGEGAGLVVAANLLANLPGGFIKFNFSAFSRLDENKDPVIENVGIRLGEIIGWRVWRIHQSGMLHSGALSAARWLPKTPMVGNPSAVGPYGDPEGVHAFLEDGDGVMEAIGDYRPHGRCDEMNRDHFMMRRKEDRMKKYGVTVLNPLAHLNPLYPEEFIGVAIGKVALWGTVIEHEKGYRAEYAQIESIDRLASVRHGVDISNWLLDQLRRTYGV